MPQSLAKILVHVVFSTKNRVPWLKRPEMREAMNGYLVGALKNLACPSLIVGSVEDHIHILCHLSRTMSMEKLAEEIKKTSSAWIKTEDRSLHDFYWQSGYGAFSVSPSNVEQVHHYIATQEEHHRRISYQDEFRAILARHDIEYDERYVWD